MIVNNDIMAKIKFMTKHLAGSKISKSHTSIIEAAEPILREVRQQIEVSKIVLGPIRKVKNGPRRVKIQNIPAGIKAICRAPNSIQDIYIYTSNPEQISAILQKFSE